MPKPRSPRQLPLLVLACGLLALALTLYPVSYRITRLLWLGSIGAFWLGLIALAWQRRALRILLIAAPLLLIGFALLPAHRAPSPDELRAAYLRDLRRYEGARYVWGGESPLGIDCSGLVRRGLIDAQTHLALQRFSPLSLRHAVSLWWRDCTARDLGDPVTGWTQPIAEARSVNELPATILQPGDLALVAAGSHIMAYLGDQTWIEADPEKHRVIVVHTPSNTTWFTIPTQLVRWRVLDAQPAQSAAGN